MFLIFVEVLLLLEFSGDTLLEKPSLHRLLYVLPIAVLLRVDCIEPTEFKTVK